MQWRLNRHAKIGLCKNCCWYGTSLIYTRWDSAGMQLGSFRSVEGVLLHRQRAGYDGQGMIDRV